MIERKKKKKKKIIKRLMKMFRERKGERDLRNEK